MENNRNDITRILSEEMDKLEGFVEQMMFYSKSSSLQDDYKIRAVSLKNLVMKAVKRHARFMIAEHVTPEFGNLDYTVAGNTVQEKGSQRSCFLLYRREQQ